MDACFRFKKKDHNGTKFLLKIFLYIAPTCSWTSIKWIRWIYLYMETMDNTDVTNLITMDLIDWTLELMDPWEDFLSRCKDVQRIKIFLPFLKSCPLVPKMSLPSLLYFIVREVQFEIKAILDAMLNNVIVLCNQFFRWRALWVRKVWTEQCHYVENLTLW